MHRRLVSPFRVDRIYRWKECDKFCFLPDSPIQFVPLRWFRSARLNEEFRIWVWAPYATAASTLDIDMFPEGCVVSPSTGYVKPSILHQFASGEDTLAIRIRGDGKVPG